MPRNPIASTALGTYRRLVPSPVRRRISASIPQPLRTRLNLLTQSRPTRRSPSEEKILHASVDGGDTLNVAVSAKRKWAEPVLLLRRGEHKIELPTRISTDLGGFRRLESSVRLVGEPGQGSPLPVVVVDPGAWRIELRENEESSSVPLILERGYSAASPRGAAWSITGAAGDALGVKTTAASPYPRVETIGVGFTNVEIAGTLVGSWAAPLTVIVRLRGEGLQLEAPAMKENEGWRAPLPIGEMIGHDGIWECHVRDGEQTRLVRVRPTSESDRRFDLESPVRLVATPHGGLVRVRGYTTGSGDLHLSTTTINEESS